MHCSRNRSASLVLAVATAAVMAPGVVRAADPSFGISIGVRETNNAAGTPIGSNGGTTGSSIEWVNAPGVQVVADGQYHLVTFNFGTDSVTSFNAGNGILDGALGVLEHLRFVNSQGVTKPTSLFIDDVTSTPSGGSPVLLTDFMTTPAAIPNSTSNVLFRDAAFSGSTSQNFARNYTGSSATNVQPDGTIDAAQQAGRFNVRFSTPEVVNNVTGWGRITNSAASSLGPVNPVIAISAGSTLTLRVAIVVNEPQYGYVGYDGTSGNTNWSDNANWGKGANAATINAPNSTTATALFDEALPASGPATPRTVTVDAPINVQNLQFTSAVPYTIDGTSALTVTRLLNDVSPTITVEAGAQTISAPLVFASNVVTSATVFNTGYTPLVWVTTGASLNVTQPLTVNAYSTTATGTPTNSLDKRGGGRLTIIDAPVATLRLFGGTLELAPNTTSSIATVTIGTTTIPGSGGRLSISPTGNSVKTITTMSVVGTGTLAVAPETGSDVVITTLNVGAGVSLALDLPGKHSVNVGAVGLNATAKINVGDDGLFVDYLTTAPTAPTTLRTAIVTAYAGGLWNGNGIGSALLSPTSAFAIGYKALATGETFMGRTAADDTTFAIRYTLKGDGTLDGLVNFDDLLSLAQNYDPAFVPGTTPKLWSQGDSNYDGIVNFDDLLALAQNYGSSALTDGQTAIVGGSFASDFALAQSLVPEPTSIAAIGALSMLVGRRRR